MAYSSSDINQGIKNISRNIGRAGGDINRAIAIGTEDARRERLAETAEKETCPHCHLTGIRNMPYHLEHNCRQAPRDGN